MNEPRLVAEGSDRLGEGPCWDARSRRLYWFDIKGRRLNWLGPGDRGSYDLPCRCSVATPLASGGLLIVGEEGLFRFDPRSGAMSLIEDGLKLPKGFRTNDGKIDVHGRLWWSVMDDDGGKRPGCVYRRSPGEPSVEVLSGVHIANTCCCSPDGRVFYLCDSGKQTIFAYDLDPFSGVLSGKRVFAHTKGEAGSPDGSAVDAEGYLWNAQWGAWRIVRYAPDGRIDRIVEVPVEQPSSCAFGGEGLATLFVTTARDGLSDEALARQPLAGSLLAFEPGVAGLPLPMFDDRAEPLRALAG